MKSQFDFNCFLLLSIHRHFINSDNWLYSKRSTIFFFFLLPWKYHSRLSTSGKVCDLNNINSAFRWSGPSVVFFFQDSRRTKHTRPCEILHFIWIISHGTCSKSPTVCSIWKRCKRSWFYISHINNMGIFFYFYFLKFYMITSVIFFIF